MSETGHSRLAADGRYCATKKKQELVFDLWAGHKTGLKLYKNHVGHFIPGDAKDRP